MRPKAKLRFQDGVWWCTHPRIHCAGTGETMEEAWHCMWDAYRYVMMLERANA